MVKSKNVKPICLPGRDLCLNVVPVFLSWWEVKYLILYGTVLGPLNFHLNCEVVNEHANTEKDFDLLHSSPTNIYNWNYDDCKQWKTVLEL